MPAGSNGLRPWMPRLAAPPAKLSTPPASAPRPSAAALELPLTSAPAP